MAEVLGVAASAVTMIGLAAQVLVLGYRFHEYAGDIRRAPKDIQRLMDELHSLTSVLVALRDYAVENEQSTTLQMLNIEDGPLHDCAKELRDLKQKLKPRKGLKGKIDALIWPLQENETLRHISLIERQKNLFNLALTIDHISLSKAIERYVGKTWDLVQDMETCVQDTNITVKNIETSVRQTNKLLQDIHGRATAQGLPNSGEKFRVALENRDDILNWLYPDDFNRTHVEICARRQKSTGEWLLSRPEFQDWKNERSSSRLFLGSGIPGAGKTFLSSVAIDYFRVQKQENNHGVAHVYFDYKEQKAQSPIKVLSSLVKQLAIQTSTLPATIIEWYNKRGKAIPTTEELYSIFLEVSKLFPQVFLVFDSLDECHPENQRRFLLPIFKQMGEDGINVFLTSRPHPEDIQDSLSSAVRIELSAQQDDIKTYIAKRIEENPRARRLVDQGKCKDRIISELTDCAKGMFLLVRFHVDYLCQQTNAKQLLAALGRLKNSPTGTKRPLDPTYERVIESIKGQDTSSRDLAFSILSWLVKAKRTLTVEELQVAVSIEQDRYELDDMDLPDRMTLVDVCASLVVIDESSDTVKLAHYTVQEHLVENYILPVDVDFRLAAACTTYLSFDSLTGACKSSESFRDRLKSHPFLDYVAKFIHIHLQSCDELSTTCILLRFLQSLGNIDSYYQAKDDVSWRLEYSKGCPPLYVASSFAHLTVVELLLEQGADVMGTNGARATALHAASRYGHKAVASLLLEQGADASAKDITRNTPLYLAARNEYEGMVSLLLDKGANSSAANIHGNTPLHGAAYKGHEVIVSLLLGKGADSSAANNYGDTPLHLAAFNEYEEIVSLLLDKGADSSATNNYGNTPLHDAASNGYEVIVSLLLDKGADSSAANSHGDTPLHGAASNGYEVIVSLLLDKGADSSAANSHGDTPLHGAASNGHEVIVSLLLDKGADSSAANNYGNTPLHGAACNGYEGMVSLLLDKGTDSSAANSHGDTPLHDAASNGYEVIVSLLLDKGANRSAANNDGDTPLHLAARNGHEVIVSLLLDKGADSSAANIHGNTPLHDAARDGHEVVVILLLDKGADNSATNSHGNTPLHGAAYYGHEGIASLLLENGAEVSSTNNHASTPLHHAAIGGAKATAQLLLEKGADFSATDKDGDTPLHEAALNGHTSVVGLLLEKGANMSALGTDGMTPLHWAANKGHDAVTGLLLLNGASILSVDNHGCTPLHRAISGGYGSFGEAGPGWRQVVVNLLFEKGADTLARDNRGWTPLHWAVSEGYNDVLDLLLERGADIISAADNEGNTPLHLATSKGHEEIINPLLKHGANPTAPNNRGQTALQIAESEGHAGIVHLLHTL